MLWIKESWIHFFVVEFFLAVSLFVVKLMYSKSPSLGVSSSNSTAPSCHSSPVPHTNSELSSVDNPALQGWVGDERVEIVAVHPRDEVGSVSSSSLTLAHLIAMGTPLSASITGEADLLAPSGTSKKSSFWSKTDFVSAFSQYQNSDYLHQELQEFNLPFLKSSVIGLRNEIRKIPSCTQDRQKLEKLASNLIDKIDAVIDGRKAYAKFSTKVFFALVSMGLCVLPLMVAEKNHYNRVLAAYISGYTKTLLILMGLMFSQTVNSRSFVRHLKERHVPYLTPSIPFAFSTYQKSVSEFNKNNPWAFNGISAAFCAVVYMATSSPDTFKKPIEGVFNKTKSIFGKKDLKKQNEVPQDLLDDIQSLFEVTKVQSQMFLSRRQSFENAGNAVSDVLSNQVSDIHRAYELMNKEFSRFLKLDGEPQASQVVVNLENTDFSKKLVFAVVAALLCAGSAATVYDEPVGLVGAGVDAALTTGEMLKTAFRASENAQRASEKFASYSGLTPFLLLFGLANQLPKKHFADTVAGLTVGTAMLIAATMTLPRVTSEALSKSILSLLNRIQKTAGGVKQAHAAGSSENV